MDMLESHSTEYYFDAFKHYYEGNEGLGACHLYV